MRQLTFVSRGQVEFREVPEPRLRSDEDAIVRPIASTTCDLDRAIIAGVTPPDGPSAQVSTKAGAVQLGAPPGLGYASS
jgi:hypothetical protein